MSLRARLLSATYLVWIVWTAAFCATGLIVTILVLRRLIPADGIGEWGVRALIAVAATVVSFVVVRWAVRWGDDPVPEVRSKVWKRLLEGVAILGVAVMGLALM